MSTTWSVVFLDETVRDALAMMPPDVRAAFRRIVVIVHVFEKTPRREIETALQRARKVT